MKNPIEKELRILYLEDHSTDVRLVQHELDKAKIRYTLKWVAEKGEYLQALREFAPDLILADYALPSYDGLSALAAAQAQCPEVPFIFVSGHIGEDEATELLHRGATDYVLKMRLSRLVPCLCRAIQEADERAKRRKAEQAVQQKIKDLAALNEASQIFLEVIDEISTLESICRLAVQHFGVKMAWVGLIRKDDPHIQPASVFGDEAGYLHSLRLTWDESPNGQYPAGIAIRTARAVAVNKIETDPRFAPWRTAAINCGYRSCAALPLCHGHDVLGVLTLYSAHPEYFVEDRLSVLQSFANQGASALAKARLYAQVQRAALELERKVSERTQQLQEINRELETFSYSISHDLRAPLCAMEGFAQALLEDYVDKLDETGRDYARRIVEAGKRMDAMIKDILAYSRVSRADITLGPVSLDSVLNEAQQQVEAELTNRNACITVETPLPQVIAHRPSLVQAIANLLTNAAKFVAPGVQPHIRIRAEEVKDSVRLLVIDNGIGIAPENHERIFHLFNRLHHPEEYPGTGVGLAIVRRAVTRMDGRVGVESEVGKGSKFWVELKKARS